MTGHVAERAGTKVAPAAPFESVICVLLVRAHRCGTDPQIPVEVRRHRIFARRPVDPLRPNWAIAPDVQFGWVADQPSLNHFDGATQTAASTALIAHLCSDFPFFRETPQRPRLIDRVCERLLAINVFAH